MKAKLLHMKLVKAGYFNAGRLLLKALNTGKCRIVDGDDEAYESGLAAWLQDNARQWHNSRGGFTAYL